MCLFQASAFFLGSKCLGPKQTPPNPYNDLKTNGVQLLLSNYKKSVVIENVILARNP